MLLDFLGRRTDTLSMDNEKKEKLMTKEQLDAYRKAFAQKEKDEGKFPVRSKEAKKV